MDEHDNAPGIAAKSTRGTQLPKNADGNVREREVLIALADI